MAAAFRQLTRAGAALVVVVAMVSAAKQLPSSVRAADVRIAENAELSQLERELAPARAFGLNPTLVLRADEGLPREAVFYVVTRPGLAGHDAAGPFSAYWLLPRRHTDDLRQADWILSFGADPADLGVQVDVVDELGDGEKLLRVRR